MQLETQLARLENSHLIRPTSDEELTYLFKHTLTQETTYGSMLLKRRREIHRDVAVSIERLFVGHLDEQAALLARHYAEAGDDVKTLEYARRAGDAAARVYAGTEALAHYSLALDAAGRQTGNRQDVQVLKDLFLKRGRALELLSRFLQAAENYDEMYAQARALGDRSFELAARIAQVTIRAIPSSARDPAQARLLSDQALALARELGDRGAEAKLLWSLLVLNIYTAGDPKEAIRYGEQAAQIARELNLREQLAFALHDLFVAYAYLGDYEKAIELRLEAGGIWRELDNKPMLAENETGVAFFFLLTGERDRGLPFALDAYQIGQAIGNLGSQGFSGYVLGLTYLEQGDYKQATEYARAASPITDYGGLEGNGGSVEALLATIYAEGGDVKQAVELVQSARRRPAAGLPFQRMWLAAVLTRLELLGGNVAAAEDAFREGAVVASVENFGRLFPPSAPTLFLAAGELELAREDYDHAAELMTTLIDRLHAVKTRYCLADALLIRGQAISALGRNESALADWRAACSEAEATQARRILWRSLAILAQAEAESGNAEEARCLSARALTVVRYIAEHAPPELRESFLKRADVQRITPS